MASPFGGTLILRGHIHQPFMFCIIQVKSGIWRLSRRKYEAPWLHGQALPCALTWVVLLWYWYTVHTVFSVLGEQQHGQKQLWAEPSSGFGAAFQLQLYPALWILSADPRVPPWLGPRGALSPWPAPAWLCWSPLSVGDTAAGEVPAAGCPSAPLGWQQAFGASEDRQSWAEIQWKETHMNWAAPLALQTYGCLCKATAMGHLNLPLEGFWNEEDYCSI